jgi:hypothetical protein
VSVETVIRNTLQEHNCHHTPIIKQLPTQKNNPSFTAFTNMRTGQSTIAYNPTFQPSKKGHHFCKEKNIAQPLETCVRDVTAHECGHIPNSQQLACPGTIEAHEEYFYEPMAKVLVPKEKRGALDTMTNLAEDLIDNTLKAQGAHAGLTIFYQDEAEKQGYTPAYEAFMRIQMASGEELQCMTVILTHQAYQHHINKTLEAMQ